MNHHRCAALRVLCVLAIAGLAGCAAQAAAPPPAPAPVYVSPAPATRQDADQDWNIFPDPTTGTVEVYHHGQYVGAITGDEPANQDPPLPHHVDE
jgi:hypothetical protein